MSADVRDRLAALAQRYELRNGAIDQMQRLLELVADEPSAITSVRDPAAGVDTHVADSLVALELPAVREAQRIADLGSGGGFPGLVLAIALPTARIALVESVSRKCAFLRAAVANLQVGNADVIHARAEAWPEGIGAHDLVTARALAALQVLVEYAAPLLEVGGHLVAWKGQPDPSEEADGRAAAATLGMSAPESVEVAPFASAISRRLYVSSKVMSTPAGYPRRPGMARKRPLRVSG